MHTRGIVKKRSRRCRQNPVPLISRKPSNCTPSHDGRSGHVPHPSSQPPVDNDPPDMQTENFHINRDQPEEDPSTEINEFQAQANHAHPPPSILPSSSSPPNTPYAPPSEHLHHQLDRTTLERTTRDDVEEEEGEMSSEDDSDSESHLLSMFIDMYMDDLNPSFDIFQENGDVEQEMGIEDDELKDDGVFQQTEEREGESIDDSMMVQRAEKVVSSLRKLMPRNVLLAIISLYGKCRYTLEHYEHLVAMMRDANDEVTLPCSSTMQKVVFPRLLGKLFVKSSVESFPTKSGFSTHSSRSSLAKTQNEAVVALPSSWAKMDVKCVHILRELVCCEQCRCRRELGSSDLRVDSTSHVVKREEHSKRADVLWVNKEGVPIPSSIGMTIRFHTADRDALSESISMYSRLESSEVRYRRESYMAFNADIVSTHHVRFNSDKGIFIEAGDQSSNLNVGVQRLHDECLTYIEKLCVRNHEDFDMQESNEGEAARPESRSPQTRRQRQKDLHGSTTDNTSRPRYLIPGDHITIVKLDGNGSLGVFVSRFWVRRLDDERNFFLFLSKDSIGRLHHSSVSTVGAPAFIGNNSSSIHSTTQEQHECRTTGHLNDGTRFYVYRILLYADDFNPRSTLFPKGSVGGFYMSPCSMNIKSRRSQASIRTISLTPAGVSTNAVFDFIIEDLVSGSLEGFSCVDAFGVEVKVYFDIMGFLGDYPASSHVVDLNGHTAIAPCTQCGFTYTDIEGTSKFAYTTSINCSNTAFQRTQDRTTSIRAAGLTEHQNKCLGMKVIEPNEFLTSEKCPMLKLASRYNDQLKVVNDVPPFAAFKKDGYNLNLIAPDHLISGLFKGVLTIVFIQLASETVRDQVQICVKSALSDYGFQSQTVIFNHKKKKLMPGLSMSMLYCILTVIPSILQGLNALDALPSKRLLLNLHRFFSMAFWWPRENVDGTKAWQFVHGKNIHSYHHTLKVLAANFLKSADKFIKSNPDLARHIDRPNMHRLLELSHHTITLFNHVSYICELVFESSHQPLKFFLSRNHSLSSHIYSVHLVFARDWMIRLWSLWRLYRDESEPPRHRQYALTGILRILVGEEVEQVNWSSASVSSYLDEARDHVHRLLIGTIESRLSKWYSDTRLSYNVAPKWILFTPPRTHSFSLEQTQFFHLTSARLARLCVEEAERVVVCYRALLDRGYGSSGKSQHERLELGNVVEVLTKKGYETSTFLSASFSTTGFPSFFVIGGFLKCSGRSFAVVKKCTLVSPSSVNQLPDCNRTPLIEVSTDNFYSELSHSTYHFLELTGNVTKVGVSHHCSKKGSCVFQMESRRVVHSSTTLEGGHWFLLTRAMGYPPRRS